MCSSKLYLGTSLIIKCGWWLYAITVLAHGRHLQSLSRGKFNNASALERSLYWCQALHIMNKDRYQSTSARRALALLNSPQVLEVLSCWNVIYVA